MKKLEELLSGGDLRSIGQSNHLVSIIITQKDFDQLFQLLSNENRLIAMRAADAIEKITIKSPQYLSKHKTALLALCYTAKEKELKWHLALLLPRLKLNDAELGKAWDTLTKWAKDKTNSRIVRVNAVQALFELLIQQDALIDDFKLTLLEIETENIPSINARIRLLRKQYK